MENKITSPVKLKTKNLAFLDYYDGDGARQFSIFNCEYSDLEGDLYFRDIDSAEVYRLANDNGLKMQEAPVLTNFYSKRAIRLSQDDLLFKADSSDAVSEDGEEYSSSNEFAARFQVCAKDLNSFKDKVKFVTIASRLRGEEVSEEDLIELVRAVNRNERRLVREGKAQTKQTFKQLFRENVSKMLGTLSEGFDTLGKMEEEFKHRRVEDLARYEFEETNGKDL